MMDFDGAVAIVTGAGRGLGREYAVMLAARGCRIVVNDLGVRSTGAATDIDPASEVAEAILHAGGTAVSDRHDIVSEATDVIDCAISHFGRLDIVINNAGTLNGGLFAETSAEIWHRVVDVHYRGTVAMCRAAWPHLVASRAGRIINTSSSAMFGGPQLTSYGSAKAAIFGLTKSLAIEGGADGICVNAVMPSAMTRMTDAITDPDVLRVLHAYLQPTRVSPFVAWLAHPDTKVTGEVFRISGSRASRIVAATAPSVHAEQDTPEAWAALSSALMASGAGLTELPSTVVAFAHELQEADGSFDLRALVESGGILHDEAARTN